MKFAAIAIGLSIDSITVNTVGNQCHLIEATNCLMQSLEAGEDRGLSLSWLREINVILHGSSYADAETERLRAHYDYTGRIPKLPAEERKIEGLLILTGFGEQPAKNEAYQELKQHFSSAIQYYARRYRRTLLSEYPNMNVFEFAAEGIFEAAIAYKSTITTKPSGFIRLEIRNHLYETVNEIKEQKRSWILYGNVEDEREDTDVPPIELVPDPGASPLGALCEMEREQKWMPTIERCFTTHFRHQPKVVELYTAVFRGMFNSKKKLSCRELSEQLKAQGILVSKTKVNEVFRQGCKLLQQEANIRDFYQSDVVA